MKLATYHDGSRDGQLVVVSRDLASAHFATGIASRMQQLLDDWNFLSPQLEDLSAALNDGKARHAFAFDARLCRAPLARAHACIVAGADDGIPRPAPSDGLLGPCDRVAGADGLDCGAALAVATGDVERGLSTAEALDRVRLLMLVNLWTLRGGEHTPALPAAFGPVAVTPDEAGTDWQGGRLRLTLQARLNGKPEGPLDVAAGLHHDFGALLAGAARHHGLHAGAIVVGALQRAAPRPEALAEGDRIRLEIQGRDGHSVFGAIDQEVAAPAR